MTSHALIATVVTKCLTDRGAQLPLAEEYDYVAAGLVDSLSLLRFVLELEERLSIAISEEMLLDPRFRTVGGLQTLLLEVMS